MRPESPNTTDSVAVPASASYVTRFFIPTETPSGLTRPSFAKVASATVFVTVMMPIGAPFPGFSALVFRTTGTLVAPPASDSASGEGDLAFLRP